MEAWALAHPWLTFFLVLAALRVCWMPFLIINRILRHRNIMARGWPPEHLDADGDVVKRPEEPTSQRRSRTIVES